MTCLVAKAFIPNPDDKLMVDHIDENKVNNGVSNLRWATRTENSHNIGLKLNNTSGYKGVHFDNKSKKWQAQIRVNGKKIYLDSFLNKEDAVTIRLQRAKDEFGEYLNKCEIILNV